MAEFVIKGDTFDPQIITDALNIEPTRCFAKNSNEKPKIYTDEEVPKTLVKLTDNELKDLFRNEEFQRELSKNPPLRRFSLWEIGTGYEESVDINDQLAKIYDLLKDKTDTLNKLREAYNLSYTIGIVPQIANDEKPALWFDHYIIDFAHQIKAVIDIDLYIYS